jgi:hypothetical protein
MKAIKGDDMERSSLSMQLSHVASRLRLFKSHALREGPTRV